MDDEKETGRVEAFSDGVFAVAITLLILNIQLPSAQTFKNDQAMWSFFGDQWPMLIAFVTSFATIGVMWLNHHKLFKHIRYVDNTLILLNLLLLLTIVFIPYPTALLAQQYIHYPSQHAAAIIYSGTNILMAVGFNMLWRYASHKNHLLSKNADKEEVEAITRQYRFGPLLYIIIFALAWFSTLASIALILFLAIFFALPFRSLFPANKQIKTNKDLEQASQ